MEIVVNGKLMKSTNGLYSLKKFHNPPSIPLTAKLRWNTPLFIAGLSIRRRRLVEFKASEITACVNTSLDPGKALYTQLIKYGGQLI